MIFFFVLELKEDVLSFSHDCIDHVFWWTGSVQADKQVDEILQYISTSIKSALRLSTAIESISSPVSNIFTVQSVV